MTIDLESTHKVPKDETRRRILRFLNEKKRCNLHRTDGASTGTLNHHLKGLGDLLTKEAAEQYAIIAKGKGISRLGTFREEKAGTL